MRIYVWEDRRDPGPPRVMLQRGECSRGYCLQWAISISDGTNGITARFDSREEFDEFLKRGELEEGDGKHLRLVPQAKAQ